MYTFRKFFSLNNVFAISLLAIAGSVVLVGVVWAGSTALERQQNQFISISPDSDVDLPDDASSDDSVIEGNYEQRISELEQTLDVLLEDSADLFVRLTDIEKSSDSLNAQIVQLQSDVSDVQVKIQSALIEIDELKKVISGVDNRLSDLAALVAKKTSAIDEDGRYVGSIAPSQITPQLRVGDIGGNWPMNRTIGDLDISRLNPDLSWCSPDSRNHSVLSVDGFRRIACIRIPK